MAGVWAGEVREFPPRHIRRPATPDAAVQDRELVSRGSVSFKCLIASPRSIPVYTDIFKKCSLISFLSFNSTFVLLPLATTIYTYTLDCRLPLLPRASSPLWEISGTMSLFRNAVLASPIRNSVRRSFTRPASPLQCQQAYAPAQSRRVISTSTGTCLSQKTSDVVNQY